MRTAPKTKQAMQKKTPILLPFFPGGRPDETIGSIGVRYHIQRGNSSTAKTYKELFGLLPFPLTFTVQPNLEKLAERLPGDVHDNLRRFEQDNTLMPLFQLFNGASTTGKQHSASTPAKTNRSRRVLGSTHVTNLCPDCLIEDDKKFGVPYIHRSHQIPGVTTCWRHNRALLDCCPTCGCPYSAHGELIKSPWQGCTSCGKKTEDLAKEVSEQPTKVEIEFAIFAKDLLHFNSLNLSNSIVFKMYIQRAQELGLGWGDGRINRQKVLKKIRTIFGTTLLRKIDPAFKTGKLSGWFRALESSSIEAPLHRHLMVSFILFRNIAQFEKSAKKVLDFQLKPESASCVAPTSNIDKNVEDVNQIISDLALTATRYGYNIKQLWLYRFSTMQRLVKIQPEAVKTLERVLKSKPKAPKQIKAKGASAVRKDRDAEDDIKWRDSIIAAAKKMYGEETRPMRISANRIVNSAEYAPKGCRYPIECRFPLAYATAVAYGESLWHFYARRMLWTLQTLADLDASPWTLVRHAGLELYKGKAILEYFDSVARGGGSSISGINTILEIRSISRAWAGPCPDRTFYAAGRAYRLRTNRRGNIGDKASDHRQVISPGAASI